MSRIFNKLSFSLVLIVGVFLHNASFANEELIRAEVRKRQSAGLRSELISFAAKTGFGASMALGASYCLPESWSSLGGFGGMGMLYLCKDKFSEVASVMGLTEPSETVVRAKRLNELEEKFAINEGQMGNYNSNELRRLIGESRSKIGYGIKTVHEYERKIADNLMTKIENILKLPLKPTKSLSDEELETALGTLEAHLETYSDSVHDAIIKAAIKINNLARAHESQIGNKESGEAAKASFWFIGEAGVGKTETAEVLAKSLKRSFCKLNLAGSSVEDLYGKKASNNYDSYERAGDLSAFARCYLAPDFGEPSLDPIIFIDEVHDALNGEGKFARAVYSLLKVVTEGKEKYIHENGLGIQLYIGDTIFIFGSNVFAEQDKANALASRVKTIVFDNLSFEQKEKIGERNFERLCKLNAYNPKANDQKNLSEICKLDRSPGARVLQNVVDDFIIDNQARAHGRLRAKEYNKEQAILEHGGKLK